MFLLQKREAIFVLLFAFILFGFKPGFAREFSDEQLKQEEALLMLGEQFVITATKTKKDIAHAPAVVTVFTAKEIKDMGARTWIDVLENVPGFEAMRGHHSNQRIGVRGILNEKANKIKVMVDGQNLSEALTASAFHFSFSEMPVDFIERIEIIRGPGSALYGENAFLAVINIITKKADDISGVIVEAGAGSFDTQNYNVLAGKVFSDFKASAYVDYFESDGADLNIIRDSIGRNGPTKDNMQRIYSNLNFSYKDLSLSVLLMDKRSGPNITTTYAVTDEGYFDITRVVTNLKYEHRPNKNLLIKPRVYYDWFDWVFQNELYPEGTSLSGTNYPDGILMRRSTKNKTWGGELETHLSFLKRHETLLGAQYQQTHFNTTKLYANFNPENNQPLPEGFQEVTGWGSFIDPAFKQEFWSVYLQDEWSVIDEVTLTYGGRYDHYSNFDSEFNPRVSLLWEMLDYLHLKLLYGEGFRAPDAFEQTSRNNLTSQGNPDINPEKIKTYEVGLMYKPTRYFQADVNFFYNKVHDIIVFAPRTSPLEPQLYINADEVRSKGVEFSVKSEYSNDTYVRANYSYADPKLGNGTHAYDISKHKFNVLLNTYICKYLNGNINLVYRGSKKRIANDPRGKIPSHYVVNATLLVHNFCPNLELNASVYNLLDKEYADPISTRLYNDIPREGRSYMVYLRYKF